MQGRRALSEAVPTLAAPLQVKRRETEQQTEARLRSYAHLAAQEEADHWVPLEFHGDTSGACLRLRGKGRRAGEGGWGGQTRCAVGRAANPRSRALMR